MTATAQENQHILGQKSLGVWLLITGIIGWVSSFQLMLDKLLYLENPDANLSCNFGLTVQCGTNLNSSQGELFGFPNPLVGVAAFIFPIMIGVLILSGVRITRWILGGLNLGVVLGMVWVIWFIYQSIYVLGSLCPWCMTMWVAMIFMFWHLLFASFANGTFGSKDSRQALGRNLYSWGWVIGIFTLLLIAVLAHLRLDLIANF